jgi:hypothetical protein
MRLPWRSGPRRVQHKPLVQVPFYGRETLLTALEAHLQAARQGTGQFVTLAGLAGSGKSALLTEFTLARCPKPASFVVRLNAAGWVVASEWYVHLLGALQAQSEKTLTAFYNDTKHFRRALAVTWDEAEFRTFLSSADWTKIQDQPQAKGPGPIRRTDALGQILIMAREHPWAVGAATMAEVMTRDASVGRQEGAPAQRWEGLLQALQKRGLPPAAVFVVLIEHLPDNSPHREHWIEQWRHFARVTAESALPFLVVWTALPEALQPVRQALQGNALWTEHRLEGLTTAELQPLLPRLRRALPRGIQSSWERLVTANAATFGNPAALLLSTTCVTATAKGQPLSEQMLSAIAAANATELVRRLIECIAQRQDAPAGLLRQLTEICAFWPPGGEMTIDDLFLYCDLEAVGLDLVAGRAALEKLVGAFVHYGLLGYEPYTMRYTAGNQLIQQTLQAYVYPAEGARQTVARRRRHAAAVLWHVQRDSGEVLQALAQQIDAEEGSVTPSLLAPYLVLPLRRLLACSTKAERQRVASALGKFPSFLAVEVLTTLLEDEDGQVRSRAVQSLADLDGLDTLPALLRALQDTNGDVRWIAALALGKMERPETVEALITLLTDEDKEVGRIAAEGLGQKGDRRAVPHLIAAMHDSYPLLRESAALALGQLADTRALPALQELLQDANMQVRRCAELALARLSPSV